MKKKIARVLLINPFHVEKEYDVRVIKSGGYFAEDPIGLRYLVSYLKKNNSTINVKIYDANLEAIRYLKSQGACDMDVLWRMMKDEIVRFRPDMVGISCLFHFSSTMAHKTCAQVKSVSKDIITVMGGVYPTVSFDEALKDQNLDYVVFSEGESTLSSLIMALNGNEDPSRIIDGFAFRDKNNNIIDIPKKMFINLNSIPWPDREGTLSYAYRPRHYIARDLDSKMTKIATMVGSRGCPWKCSFCSTKILWGNRARYRSVDDIIAEMRYLYDKFNINAFIFNDDNISVNKRFVLLLCDAIRRSQMKIRWATGGLQVSTLTDDVVQAMYESGFVIFNLGIETGSSSTMQKIKKPLKLEAVSDVVARIRKYGNGYILGMFIIGFPFETKDDIQDTLKFIGDLDIDWKAIFCFKPFPGTTDYDYCIERGYIKKHVTQFSDYSKATKFSTEHFTFDYIEDCGYMANLRYNFIDNCNMKKGNFVRAVKDFKYVLNIEPQHAVAYYALGKSYSMMNEKEKAAESFNAAKSIISSFEKWKGYFDRLGICI